MAYSQQDGKSREALSLDNCDREPVHIPGHIQGFSCLIAADAQLETITYCSANAQQILNRPVKAVLGKPLSSLFDAETLHQLRNVLSLSSCRVQRERVATYKAGNGAYEMWAHLSDGMPVIELEDIPPEDLEHSQSILAVRSLLSHIQQQQDLNAALRDAVLGLRNLTGFDRVMAYKFDSDGDGEVVAEARGANLEPFLGLRFPNWDIPKQARAIMRKLPIRVIVDVASQPVDLLAHAADAPPLDLTLAASRGTSPIHLEYLQNMGVGGSMTLSIVVQDTLWGLLAFHHSSARRVGPSIRGAAELFVQFFALHMEQRLEKARNAARADTLAHQSALLDAVDTATDMAALIKDIAPAFCRIVAADGLAIISPDSVITHGLAPSHQHARAIASHLLAAAQDDVHSTACLTAEGLPAEGCAGALALCLDEDTQNQLVFFRKHAALSVTWAGAPSKDIVEDDDGPRLKPRGSFRAYKEAVKDRCLPWETPHILAAQEARHALARADAALFRRLSQRAERQRSIYIAELNHRVRNIMALIRSLSRRAQASSKSLETYAAALEERIAALGAAHDLAANHVTSGVNITTLFETEMKPYTHNGKAQYSMAGRPFVIRADVAPIFALVAHELVTNCVKYGALSCEDGHVAITVDDTLNGIQIVWQESGGPQTAEPDERGFGLSLIENAVPYELDGESKISFLASGLRAEFLLPKTLVDSLEDALAGQRHMPTQAKQDAPLMPECVLLVEDSMMIAIDMTDMLNAIGVQQVHSCATNAQAARALESRTPDFAVLDVNLRSENSYETAELLQRRSVPFCFATGYGADLSPPPQYREVPVLTKPVDDALLRTTILDIMKKASA